MTHDIDKKDILAWLARMPFLLNIHFSKSSVEGGFADAASF